MRLPPLAPIGNCRHIAPVETPALARPAGHLPKGRDRRMTDAVTENCIRCKYMDCVEVCPVDPASYVGANMLVIHPEEVHRLRRLRARMPGGSDRAGQRRQGQHPWLETNRTYAALWPNITRKGEPPEDADEWKDKPGKAEQFSPDP